MIENSGRKEIPLTALIATSQKCKLHIIIHRNYKSYDNDAFRSEVQSFCSLNKTDLRLFKELIFCIFNKHAPISKK